MTKPAKIEKKLSKRGGPMGGPKFTNEERAKAIEIARRGAIHGDNTFAIKRRIEEEMSKLKKKPVTLSHVTVGGYVALAQEMNRRAYNESSEHLASHQLATMLRIQSIAAKRYEEEGMHGSAFIATKCADVINRLMGLNKARPAVVESERIAFVRTMMEALESVPGVTTQTLAIVAEKFAEISRANARMIEAEMVESEEEDDEEEKET